MASQGKGGKTKGASFERKITNRLTKWCVNKGLTDKIFTRVPASGGLEWKHRSDTIGDVTCSDKTFKNTIECKCREDWKHKSFVEIGEPCKSGLYSWWEQACREAAEAGKYPWLILKKNNCKELLIFSETDTVTLLQANKLSDVVNTRIPTFENYGWNYVCVIPLELFLGVADPHMFIDKDSE